MPLINSFVHILFYILLVSSAITLFLMLFLLIARALKKRAGTAGDEYERLKMVTTWAALCASMGSFALAVINFSFPIGVLPEADPAYNAIKEFYSSIQRRNCDTAWALIHSARKTILKEDFGFDRDAFCEAYKTTQTYQNLQIDKEEKKTDLLSSRVYRVSYDVEDVLPRNELFDLQQKDFADAVRSVPTDENHYSDSVIANLRLYFMVPDETTNSIKDILTKLPFWYLSDPSMIQEVRRLLRIKYKIVLQPNDSASPARRVQRYYVHSIIMMQEDGGGWKIRDGLANPVLVAPIVPRDRLL